jgi:hypothetical protein
MSTTALDRAPRRITPTEINPVAWGASAELSYDEWLRQGSRLGLAGRSAAWWIGDWVRYGTSRYGSKYSAAARVTGYDRQTLMNMVYVATRFDVSRRRENLSWSHHAELAALDDAEQERWLNRATVERLSVRDLRDELLSAKGPGGRSSGGARAAGSSAHSHRPKAVTSPRDLDTEAPPYDAAERVAVCPECGHRFIS